MSGEQQQTGTPEQTGDSQTDQGTPANAPEGTAPEGQQQAGTDQNVERDDKGRFRNSAKDRIDELTRKQREAEREAEYWRQRATSGQQQAPQPEAPKKPTPDQFDTYDAYVEALTEFKAEEKAKALLDERDRKAAEQQQADTRASTWAERQEAARKELADYDQVVGESDTPVAQHVVELLLDSDVGPQLSYHLAKNPELAERLNGMTEKQAAREIGRLEAQLAKPTAAAATTPGPKDAAARTSAKEPARAAAPTPRTTKAPPPVKPVGQGQSATNDPAKMGHEEYRAWRTAQGASWARR